MAPGVCSGRESPPLSAARPEVGGRWGACIDTRCASLTPRELLGRSGLIIDKQSYAIDGRLGWLAPRPLLREAPIVTIGAASGSLDWGPRERISEAPGKRRFPALLLSRAPQPVGPSHGNAHSRETRSGGASRRDSSFMAPLMQISGRQSAATWLILPVVICLSQRLSHACLSINCFIL